MDFMLIFEGKATIEELETLFEKKDMTFVIEDGNITEIIY